MTAYQFDMTQHRLPESYDLGEPARRVAGRGQIGTIEQRQEWAKLVHRMADNMMAHEGAARRVLSAEDQGMAHQAALEWRNSVDCMTVWDALNSKEGSDEVSDGLPTKAILARDVYNVALDGTEDADDRLKAFRLYGEIQGFVNRGGATVNTNIDARSIILVPRRSSRVDDPDHEQKVIEAQARLVTDATQRK